jgi:hypothetical protein
MGLIPFVCGIGRNGAHLQFREANSESDAPRVQYLKIKDGAEQKYKYHVGENLLFRRRGHDRFLGQEQYNARLASAT